MQRCLFFFVIVFLMVLPDMAAAQVKIYPNLNKEDYHFWKNYELAQSYLNSDLKKADSLRQELVLFSASLNDSAKFYALVLDADLDKINGSNSLYLNKTHQIIGFQFALKGYGEQLEITKKKAELYLFQRDFSNAESSVKATITEAKRNRDNKGLSELYTLLAKSKMQQNQKDSSLIYINEAIQYARRSAQKSFQAMAINNQAMIYHHFGQIELSVSKNLIALQLAQSVGNIFQQARYALSLGQSQLMIHNDKEASFYFNQAIQLAARLKDEHLSGLARIQLGIIAFHSKNYAKAIDQELQAIKTLTYFEDFDGLGTAFNTLGDIYRELREYQKAASNYNKALVYFESSGNKEKIATVYHSVGIVFEKQGKYANALNYLNRSAEIFSEFGFQALLFNTYRSISDVYQKTGNYKTALDYLSLYVNYADSARTLESSAKIAELNETYRTEQRERLISMQADSIQRQIQDKALTATKLEVFQLKNEMKTYIIIGFSIVVLLAGIIIFYRWNQSNIRQQQKEAEMNQTLLRTQMNPHFIFNAMSVIQSYIYDNDTGNSTKFLVSFSRLMRLILENSSKEFIAMTTEIDILDKYLSIQKLRFEDRFEYTIEVEQRLIDEDAVIPPMITQPFIENAIEHGRLHLRADGFIHINFKGAGDMMHISIEDNGIGRKNAELNKKGSDHKSMAMKITKERIDILNRKYRSDGSIIIEDYNKTEETGTVVLISIPYRLNSLL